MRPVQSDRPVLRRARRKSSQTSTFVKVDVDELDDVAASCGISAMPTFQLYSNGVMVKEMCGADKAKLEALANEANEL